VLGDFVVPVPTVALLFSVLFGLTAMVVNRARGTSVPAPFPVRLLWALLLAIVLGTIQFVGSLLLAALAAYVHVPCPPVIDVEDRFRAFCSTAWTALNQWVTGKRG
jgi:hypothetical protein